MLKIALSLVVWLAAPSATFACSFARAPDFEIDASIKDSEFPAAAVVKEVRITRGKGLSRQHGRVIAWNSCDDIGTIGIESDTDDPDVGYFLARVDGNLPSGLTLPESARPAWGLSLHWIDGRADHQDAFGFTLQITSVGRSGRLGEPIEILIEDDGIRWSRFTQPALDHPAAPALVAFSADPPLARETTPLGTARNSIAATAASA